MLVGATCRAQSLPVPAGSPHSWAVSAAENELITELASPVVGKPPAALPNWTSMLLGPLYRGTEVTVK